MARQRSRNPKLRIPPDGDKILWCPFCDWHHNDSFRGRNFLGNHLVNEHPDEVVYAKGEEPPDLEEV